MANTLSVMTNVLRNVVSKQRIRYKEKGFNLDLAYISDNIIAMGYPADKIESIYRNRLEDVYKFLEENHRDHYKIYNLCLERSYDSNKFHGRVAVYPFEDHNPPTIELIQKFCNDVDSWLKSDRQNVAAVHCKAGKGRTGTMICCYLLYSRQQGSAEDALACYDEKRTKDRKGVTIPSQRRYVQYFSWLIRSGIPYEKRTLQFREIRFTEANQLQSQGTVNCSISVLHDTPCAVKVQTLQNFTIDFRKSFILEIKNPSLCVNGDIKVELTHKTSKKKIFHFWFNTFFVCNGAAVEKEGEDVKLVYTLNKNEIDDAHKDREHKCYSEDFKVQLIFYTDTSCARGQNDVSGGVSSSNNIGLNNHRMSQSARLTQLNSYGVSRESNSSGSYLNYHCDQQSSSSAASVSSLGGGCNEDILRNSFDADNRGLRNCVGNEFELVGYRSIANSYSSDQRMSTCSHSQQSFEVGVPPALPLSPPPSYAHFNDTSVVTEAVKHHKSNNIVHHQNNSSSSNSSQGHTVVATSTPNQKHFYKPAHTFPNNISVRQQLDLELNQQQYQPSASVPRTSKDNTSNNINISAQQNHNNAHSHHQNYNHNTQNSSQVQLNKQHQHQISGNSSESSSSATGDNEIDEVEEDWESGESTYL